jgi:putative holliday junction resolvase
MKYLGIDYGSKRTGVAVSDTAGRVAVVKETIELGSQQGVIDRIKEIIVQDSVDVVVIGRPTNMSGEGTQQTETVDRFVEKLRNHVDVPVQVTDERLTTEAAKTLLHGVKMQERDQVAAQILLQNFLDQQHVNES